MTQQSLAQIAVSGSTESWGEAKNGALCDVEGNCGKPISKELPIEGFNSMLTVVMDTLSALKERHWNRRGVMDEHGVDASFLFNLLTIPSANPTCARQAPRRVLKDDPKARAGWGP